MSSRGGFSPARRPTRFGEPVKRQPAMPMRAMRGDTGTTDPREPGQDAKLAWTRQGPARPKRPATAGSCSTGGAWTSSAVSPRADFSQDWVPGVMRSSTARAMRGRPLDRESHPFRERRFLLARYEYAPRHVVDARWLGDYKVWLEFNDGRKGVVDLADELHGEELEPLRDRHRFSQFYLDYGLASIAWLDGQDFTPEFLYDKLTPMH